jgi:hypothetical protein
MWLALFLLTLCGTLLAVYLHGKSPDFFRRRKNASKLNYLPKRQPRINPNLNSYFYQESLGQNICIKHRYLAQKVQIQSITSVYICRGLSHPTGWAAVPSENISRTVKKAFRYSRPQ